MQPKNKGRKRILRTNASVSGPIKVRNLKTGELAIYTPDRLQPTIPAGWVPLNSNRQQSRTPSRNFRRNSGLVVQTCGNQYRILNSSRQVVARGRLNASEALRGSKLNAWRYQSADIDDSEYWTNRPFDPDRPDLTANPDEMPPDVAADVRAYRDVDDYFRKYDYPDDYDWKDDSQRPVYHGPHSEYEGMQDHEAEMYFLSKHPEFASQPDDWGELDDEYYDEETDVYEDADSDEDF